MTRAKVDYGAEVQKRREAAAKAEEERLAKERLVGEAPKDVPTPAAADKPPKESVKGKTGKRSRVSAYTPIARKANNDASGDDPRPARQGIDMREIDWERIDEFDVLCKRVRIGKKKGLSLYARAGFKLLEQLFTTDPEAAKDLLRSLTDEGSPTS